MRHFISIYFIVIFVHFFQNVHLVNGANDDKGRLRSTLEERLLELQFQNSRLQLELYKARKDLEDRQAMNGPTNIIIFTAASSEIKNLQQKCSSSREKVSGVYQLNNYAPGQTALKVFCDFDVQGGGWTVIQRRINGSVNFNRSWQEYKNGFGDVDDEHWLGLKHIHTMTTQEPHELLIILEDFDNQTRWARYDWFVVGDESEQYSINTLGAFSGDAENSFSGHITDKFSTFDKDNDIWKEGSCAAFYKGGWWYSRCLTTNLNGPAIRGEFDKTQCCRGIHWLGFRGNQYSLKSSQMMIRPKSYVVPK